MSTINEEADAIIERMKADGAVSMIQKEAIKAHLNGAIGILGVAITATVAGSEMDKSDMETLLIHMEDALQAAKTTLHDTMEELTR